MKQNPDKLYIFLICAGLVLATLVAYEPVRKSDFVDYDDDAYVTKNPQVNSGITRESLVFFFTNSHGGMWHPLTSWSFMLGCQLFGLNPFWHHLTSLLFHIVNALLLFWVLKRMTGALWPSVFVVAAFALHPLNVESVAWVSERKTVLSCFFRLSTIAVYIRYSERPAIGRYLLVFLVYGLCIMTKPVVVTLPFVLLLLDYWPLHRFHWGFQNGAEDLPQHEPVGVSCQKLSVWRLVGEKVPLFILAGILSVITFVAQQRVGSVVPTEHWPLNLRIANALVSYISYIGKMIYPSRLAVLYPLPLGGPRLWQTIVSLLILAAVSAAVIYTARQRRYLIVGWLWYLGTLVPVIGLVQSGAQAMADRYFYLPGVGIFIMLSWFAAELSAKWRLSKIEVGMPVGLVFAILIFCTRMQVRHWRNNFTLFGHAAAVTKNNYIMRTYYGWAFLDDGQPEKALRHFREVLRVRPRYSEAREYMGMAFLDIGKDLALEGKSDQAIEYFTGAIKTDPNNAESHNNLGAELVKVNRIDEAVEEFHEALRLEPKHHQVHNNLAVVYFKQGETDKAIAHWTEALRLKPDWTEVRKNLIRLAQRKKRREEAIAQYIQMLQRNPDDPNVHDKLARVFYRQGKIEQAIKHWTKAIGLKLDWAEVHNNLAWVLATIEDEKLRNPAEAIRLAERACELSEYRQAEMLDTLGVAYAAEGRFAEAVKAAEKGIELARQAEDEKMIDDIRSRLELYKINKPYRD
jgi:tetratricopeptide (TPR) repeat protein